MFNEQLQSIFLNLRKKYIKSLKSFTIDEIPTNLDFINSEIFPEWYRDTFKAFLETLISDDKKSTITTFLNPLIGNSYFMVYFNELLTIKEANGMLMELGATPVEFIEQTLLFYKHYETFTKFTPFISINSYPDFENEIEESTQVISPFKIVKLNKIDYDKSFYDPGVFYLVKFHGFEYTKEKHQKLTSSKLEYKQQLIKKATTFSSNDYKINNYESNRYN